MAPAFMEEMGRIERQVHYVKRAAEGDTPRTIEGGKAEPIYIVLLFLRACHATSHLVTEHLVMERDRAPTVERFPNAPVLDGKEPTIYLNDGTSLSFDFGEHLDDGDRIVRAVETAVGLVRAAISSLSSVQCG